MSSRRPPRRAGRLAALLAALALIFAFAVGCGGGDDSPSSDDVPSGAVAKVGDEEIAETDLERQIDALARAQRGSGSPASGGTAAGADSEPGDAGSGDDGTSASGDEPAATERDRLRDQALAVLLAREAIEQEAADRGIEVSDAEVRERWEAAAGAQFKTKKALRRFLGGQTEQDVLDQLRLQALSERIAEQVAEEAGGGRKGQRAVRRFQREFRARWANRTACADGYDAPGCATGDAE